MNLDPRILADTLPVCMTDTAHVRLMNDRRWPWLILLPIDATAQELHDLSNIQRDAFMRDVNRASCELKRLTQCRSINVAMLGNVVAQLHCHVVARNEHDPNWPGPVWGFGSAIPYLDKQPPALCEMIRRSFDSRRGASEPLD